MNDVRFSPNGRHAYLTDSGATGVLVVVDLHNKARRVLQGYPSSQPEKDVVVRTDGQELRSPDGRGGAKFAADSIALSPDGRMLFWKVLTGQTLYRVATDVLENPRLSEEDLEARVERVAETEPTDGLWIDGRGRLYLSAIEQNAVKVRDRIASPPLSRTSGCGWPATS